MPCNCFEQRVDDGFVFRQRQELGVNKNRSSSPDAGLDLPDEHDQRLSQWGLLVDLARKWWASPMRALRVLFEPVAVVALPRIVEQGDLRGAWATTEPLDAVERLICFGDGLLIKRDRVGDLLA